MKKVYIVTGYDDHNCNELGDWKFLRIFQRKENADKCLRDVRKSYHREGITILYESLAPEMSYTIEYIETEGWRSKGCEVYRTYSIEEHELAD